MKLFELKRILTENSEDKDKKEKKEKEGIDYDFYVIKTGVKIPPGAYSCKGGKLITFREVHTLRDLERAILFHNHFNEANAYERGESTITEVPGTIFGIQNYLIIYYKVNPNLLPKKELKKEKEERYKQPELRLNIRGKSGVPEPIYLCSGRNKQEKISKRKIS